ncbi:class I SAM-dependent DNA methyltransferase [Chloroflexota bacterium]
MTGDDKLQRIYSSRDNKELEEGYDGWAAGYETDLEHDFAWSSPQAAAKVLARYVDNDVKVLDAGAGTGLVGSELAKLGFNNLVAMDLSRGMLDKANRKNVYQQLRQMVMGEPLDFITNLFDAVISVGVLTLGHAPSSSFDELVRITKPGGYIVFTLRPDVYENNGFKDKMDELESKGEWTFIEASDKFVLLPKPETKPETGYYHQIWVYQVIS